MQRFRLVVEQQPSRPPEIVEFDAHEVATALDMAARLLPRPRAEMWCDDRLLCKLSRAGDREAPFWQVG